MTESVKILTANYLDWHAKLTGLPSILTDKIRSKLYKRYKKETGNEPWQLSEVHESEVINSKPEKGPITFEARPDPELIIKSPWSSPCPICNGKHGNYGLHGSWYCENGNQLPYDPELAKFYSQDKLEYCLTCNTSSNKLKYFFRQSSFRDLGIRIARDEMSECKFVITVIKIVILNDGDRSFCRIYKHAYVIEFLFCITCNV
ncbi:hypothetical protein GLOIN_2v1790949 [Rhizophagus irregularis DAOM 181602=DAOM 197198]|nr:hypothetical protein GLOIN_2v1790949 [Rhizophagus irregularis DAOM 181602=DAOM 197198]